MSKDLKYTSYSSKGINALGTGVGYGVNEMAETALSMGLSSQRRTVVEGITNNIESEFLTDVIQDGVGAGLGYLTGKVMQAQDELLNKAFSSGGALVTAWYSRSFIKNKLKGLKGRKLGMLSKILGDTDKSVEESRLMADFVKMDIDSSVSSHNPVASHNALEGRIKKESLEVSKEGVRSQLAGLQINGMRDTFEMKIKTSSFFISDKSLIKNRTGMTKVTKKDIAKLNALSSSMVFEDSEGNWIGGNQAMAELLNGMSLHRA